jgi:hypothetical protein
VVLEKESSIDAEVITTAVTTTHDALITIAITKGSQPSLDVNSRSKCYPCNAEQCSTLSSTGCFAE